MRGFGLLLLPVVAKLASAQSQYTINVTAVPESTRGLSCHLALIVWTAF